MRIDLHFHDKRTQSEGQIYEFANYEILNLIKENDINVLGIVRHNEIDFSKIKALREEASNINCAFAFGAEIQIKWDSKNVFQIILLFSIEIVDYIEKKWDSLISKINKKNKCIDISDFIEFIKKNKSQIIDNTLLYPHYDNKKKQIKDEIKENFKSEFKDFLIIFDVNDFSKFLKWSFRNEKVLLGTDKIENKNSYSKIAKTLIKTNFNFLNFEKFIMFMKKDVLFINKILEDSNFSKKYISNLKLFSDEKGEDLNNKISKIEYYSGLNLIFGKRGSGKTILLYSLNKYFNNAAKYYQGKEIDNEYKNYETKLFHDFLTKNKNNNINWPTSIENKDHKFKIDSFYQNMKDYIENKNKSFLSKKTSYVEKMENFIFDDKWKEKIREEINNLFDGISTMEIYILNNKKLLENFLLFKNDLLKFINEETFKKFKKIQCQKLNFSLKERIEKFRKSNGIINPPKLNLFEHNKKILTFIKEIQPLIEWKDKIDKSEYILDEKSYYFGKYEYSYNIDTSVVNTISNIKNIFPLFDNKILNLQKIKEIFNLLTNEIIPSKTYEKYIKFSDEENNKISESIKNNDIFFIFNLKKRIKIDDRERNLSTGQKKEVTLDNFLNSSNEDILIIDEIDSSLDADYIQNILIDKLNQLEKEKVIFLATHNANISINSLPINWILREEVNKIWETYCGDIFSEKLFNINNDDEYVNWKNKALNILEGGSQAFMHRRKIWKL